MYKISDITPEIKRRLILFKENHLFAIFFIMVIVLIGTLGIWLKPIFLVNSISFNDFFDEFNGINLMAFSAPLLAGFVFDKALSFFSNKGDGTYENSQDIYLWFTVLFVVSLVVIVIFFALAIKNSDGFSLYSLFAWMLVLFIWIIGNIDNPNYQKKSDINAASGGEKANKENLRSGK